MAGSAVDVEIINPTYDDIVNRDDNDKRYETLQHQGITERPLPIPNKMVKQMKAYRVAVIVLSIVCALLVNAVIVVYFLTRGQDADPTDVDGGSMLCDGRDVTIEGNLTRPTTTVSLSTATSTVMDEPKTCPPCPDQGTPLCPEGYTLLRPGSNSCYKVVRRRVRFWSASGECQFSGGYLVAVESEAEDDWLYQVSGGQGSWLGGSDKTREGRWIWIGTEQQFSYTNWRPGEPNNDADGGEAALIFRSDGQGWEDISESREMPFICEIKID